MIKEQWLVKAFVTSNNAQFVFYRLCDVRFTSVRADLKLDGVTVNSRTGDFNATSLAQVVNTDTINELVVRTWFDRAGMFHFLFP